MHPRKTCLHLLRLKSKAIASATFVQSRALSLWHCVPFARALCAGLQCPAMPDPACEKHPEKRREKREVPPVRIFLPYG